MGKTVQHNTTFNKPSVNLNDRNQLQQEHLLWNMSTIKHEVNHQLARLNNATLPCSVNFHWPELAQLAPSIISLR